MSLAYSLKLELRREALNHAVTVFGGAPAGLIIEAAKQFNAYLLEDVKDDASQ